MVSFIFLLLTYVHYCVIVNNEIMFIKEVRHAAATKMPPCKLFITS
ncbi:hypothetical protein HDG70_001070 [Carboxydothermus ferrireducens DSM 11255]|uniref:Uncharacterized protein n=1 Tax=Carboxydothermus ferrireducens DSM 11255 TaxID=1119529 RepID=A0ABX2RBV8_9THEO|nr:hypothetical protein [Carboxydothermus ferrireducens DSM 11255]